MEPSAALGCHAPLTVDDFPRDKGTGECDLRGLTLAGPELAYAILDGVKSVENRSVPFLKDDWIAIHVGQSDMGSDTRDIMRTLTTHEYYQEILNGSSQKCPRGFIAGLAKFSHVLPISVMLHKGWATGRFCHVIEKVAWLDQPIKCKGALSAWKPPKHVIAEIVRQLPKLTVKATGFDVKYPPNEAALKEYKAELSLMKKRKREANYPEGDLENEDS